MKRKMTGMEIWRLIKAIVWTIGAVLVFVFRESLSWSLLYLVGWVMIVYATEQIVIHFATKKKFVESNNFFWGICELVLGCFMLIFLPDTENAYIVGCCIWAVWAMLREALEIEESVREIIEKKPALLTIVESIVSIVFSLLLLFEPDREHALHHVILLSVELITTGFVFPLIKYLYATWYLKHHKAELAKEIEEEEGYQD